MNRELVSLGYIVSTHGLRGHVKIKTHGGEGASLAPAVSLLIKKSTGENVTLTIADVRPANNQFIVSFKGITKIEDAKPLVKSELFITRAEMPALQENEYYWIDLMGCDVYTLEGTHIGSVTEIFATGGNDVISVKKEGKEMLLPIIASVIRSVNIAEKKITVDISAFTDED